MPETDPELPVLVSSGKRKFTCYPAAILVLIVNCEREFLLVSPGGAVDRWEVVSGAIEGTETLLDGARREIHEELGSRARVRILGTVNAQTFPYDQVIQNMISVTFLGHYQGGDISPGDDIRGYEYRWFGIDEILSGKVSVAVPEGQSWMFRRSLEMYDLWRDDPVDLQVTLT
ncbi:MAG: NUDIX hydrolase [Pseudomonadota bacterium]